MATTAPDLLSSPVLTPFPRYIAHLKSLNSSSASLPPLPEISPELHRIAFTHTSFVVRVGQTFEDAQVLDNERFEFHGDRVIGIALSMLIEEKHPSLTLGSMTTIFDILVGNKATLSELSRAYSLPSHLLAHPSQIHTLRLNPSLGADLFEAYVWALTKHSSLLTAIDWLHKVYSPLLELAYEELKSKSTESAKSRKTREVLEGTFVAYGAILEEWRVKNGKTVEFVRTKMTGPPHAPRFEGEVEVDGEVKGRVEGEESKKSLKHALAKKALDALNVSY